MSEQASGATGQERGSVISLVLVILVTAWDFSDALPAIA
jgi:hypothetical protein